MTHYTSLKKKNEEEEEEEEEEGALRAAQPSVIF